MSNLITLDDSGRVIEPEGKTREYKRDLSSDDRTVRTIVAFANSAGGQLIIGVGDDGSVVGTQDPFGDEERIASLISDMVSPQLVPAIDLLSVGDTTILIVDVPLSTRRPHFLSTHGPGDGVYVRVGSTTRQADSALVAELERSVRGVAFEDLTEPRATLSDLDLDALAAMRGKPADRADLVALGLAASQGGALLPTNAGILAAGKEPARFMPSAWVQCGRLRGPGGTDIFDQLEIHGPLPLAVERVLEFLRKHAFKTAVFGEVRRRDEYSIPIAPIRELVVNALAHASYAERSTPVRIGFFDDRIVIENPGLLLPGMTIESMKRASRLRNPSFARVLREAGLMEQWGTGVQRVHEQLAEAGLPAPEFEEVMDRLRVTVFLDNHGGMPSYGSGGSQYGSTAHAYARRHDRSDVGMYDVVMLAAARNCAMHRDELLRAAGLGPHSQNHSRHIAPLVERGLLELTLPDKPTSRLQRYRITELGRQFLARYG